MRILLAICLFFNAFFCFAQNVGNVECAQTVLAKEQAPDEFGKVHYAIWATNNFPMKNETGLAYQKYEVDLIIYNKYNVGDVSCFKKDGDGVFMNVIMPSILVACFIVLCILIVIMMKRF